MTSLTDRILAAVRRPGRLTRPCGCQCDPLVWGHTSCDLGPPWTVTRVLQAPTGPLVADVVITDPALD